MSKEENLPDINVTFPKYWYVVPVLIGWAAFWYLTGWWPYLFAYYLLLLFICPFGDREVIWRLLKRCFRKFDRLPYIHNVNGFALCLSRPLIIWPIETIFWYADEILFSGYRDQVVEKPWFLIGQPRSGTTKLETILSEDDQLLALRLIEMRFPYLTVQYLIDFIVWADGKFLQSKIKEFVLKYNLHHVFGHEGPRHDMRRLRYDLADEDDIIFLFHQVIHFQLVGAFPDPEVIHYMHHFDQLTPQKRRRLMNFHKACVQKVLYRRGPNKTYFCKWVAGWNGQLDEARTVYPDAQFICIVRKPEESLPSWMKLQGLLAHDMVGADVLDVPSVLKELKKQNIIWMKNEIRFCRETPKERLYLLKSDDFYQDIPGNTRKIYDYFGREIVPGSHFDQLLLKEQKEQKAHKPTKTDEKHLSQEEIKRDFPRLIEELFPSN